ncbi:acyl-CoA thioesterase [Aromatoleum sp.]|uniref:acyl-CoA thioesterase n=1 Tax=Aromatoleum sp. TaxID=2307007 RepID=UPI002FCA9166
MTAPAIAATTSTWKSLLNFLPFRMPAGYPVERHAAARRSAAQPVPGPFERDVAIRFAHCDPAGIVFYPQYFVIMNGLMEDWFSEGLRVDFADMVTRRRIGIPTVAIDCAFSKPSRLGEVVTFSVSVTRVGERSIGIEVHAVANGEVRLRATQTIVMMSLDTMKSIPIPPDVRANLSRFRAPAASPGVGTQDGGQGRAAGEPEPAAGSARREHVSS